MRGTGTQDQKWNASLRWLPGIPEERAELRTTLTYQVAPNAFIGVEYNPLADDVGLLANLRLVTETATRPMLMVGTSSDRIGTPDGRAYYATLSKDVSAWTDLPIAPYVGTAYGEFDDAWELLAGVSISWDPEWRSTHSWDGHNLHHTLDYSGWEEARLGLVVAQQDDGDLYAGLVLGKGF